jgi:site-specific DNA-methyltransferase (adenine-specific)
MIHLGDCLDILPTFRAGTVDLTVTSPPYDNLRTYNGTLNDWTAAKWQGVIRELFRVTKDGGVAVWVVGDATVNGSETGTSFRQALYAMECGFRLHDTMIWNKTVVQPLTHNRYEQAFEYNFVWAKGAPATFSAIADKPNVGAGRAISGTWRDTDGTTKPRHGAGIKVVAEYGRRGNVWDIAPAMSGGQRNGHPAPFPEALARDHILSWSNPGDVVLDPFLGSGTTAKMALMTGRRFIGIERDPAYLAIAERRIAEAKVAA